MKQKLNQFQWHEIEDGAPLPREGDDVLIITIWPDDNDLHVDMAYLRNNVWHRSGYPEQILVPKAWTPLPAVNTFRPKKH